MSREARLRDVSDEILGFFEAQLWTRHSPRLTNVRLGVRIRAQGSLA